jgi:hypothetical protein
MKKGYLWQMLWFFFAIALAFRFVAAFCVISLIHDGSLQTVGYLLICLVAVLTIECIVPVKEETRYIIPLGSILGLVVFAVWFLLMIRDATRPVYDLYGGAAFFLVCLQLVCEYVVWWLWVGAKKIIGLQES